MVSDVHEHPFFNFQSHEAIWVTTWASTGCNDAGPVDAPVSCAVCGKSREVQGTGVEWYGEVTT